MQCRLPRRIGNAAESVNYVEYIESSGTQYIDTGFKPNQDTRVVMDIQQTSADDSAAFFGTRTSKTANMYVFFLVSATQFRTDFGTSKESVNVTSTLTRFVIDKNKATTTFGEYSATNTGSNFTAPCNMTLLAVNTAGTVGTFANAKLYSCQIYNNGTLIRDYKPALDPDGVACLYDKVNREYVYNAGTGTFATGGSSGGGDSGGGSGGNDGPFAVTLIDNEGEMYDAGSHVEIDGTAYYTPQTITVDKGTQITVYCSAPGFNINSITLNGTQVGRASYVHTVDSNCTIEYYNSTIYVKKFPS